MIRQQINNSHSRQSQKGSTLLVSLMLLIVVTLLAIGGTRNTTLEEKMAGNTRDLQLAFQAAEAALREGEDTLQVANLPPFNNTNGYYEPDTELWKNVDWDPANNDVIGVATPVPGVYTQPSFYIEEMPGTTTGGGKEAGSALTIGTYRITAHGVGGSPTSEVILQVTFRR